MFAQTVYDLLATCAWKEFTINLMVLMQLVEMQIKHNHLPTVLPFHSVHYPLPKEIVRDIARSHSNQKLQDVMRAEKVKEVELKLFKVKEAPSSPQSPPPKLRIGYVSADFVNHPTADLMQSALLLHDTSKFEIFLYSITRNDSSMYRQVLQREIPNFRLLPNAKNDKACAQMIADDEIDILVNLNSHTAGERNGIFAFRPAPLQVVYLAYPGTHGASYLDYNVVDMVVSPKEHREMYTESLIYMPHCYQTNSFQDLYPEILSSSCLPSRKDHGLPEHALVFCTFNRLGRITEHIFHAWIRILKRVPNSVLWLYKHPTMAVLRLLRAAREQGIDATRFVFAGPMMPKIEHLKRLTLADVYLDTHIYNGHTTGSDFLWAGVPMVTLQGDTFPSRVGASLARAVGMQEMIATDLAGYEEKAVELGNNKEALEEMKAKLKAARLTAPLFDTARWVGSFEDALTRMWERHARGLEPEDIFPIDPGAKHRVSSLPVAGV
ncbi:hypothetical protein GUITHDRAFT_68991 [Guillardia theta CCMP2712]|uniref:O-GlcNAc transferase C-terminal domain-containing protein n=1 Tax=Guillardia theta (strain CCMP2712) TaxID=905079 RepID=L1JIQ4_GUITC|nr:hypothetical protein GUITHDRAFT_68991 [Guillardia theta CCMP2712]EKX48034.1 hypothetical protein GUITHDRAFT_68991 [Guillardia theta CCMP2712]|eukprot:XP_005835014.1 hypothetical protein GUITHDRAFT_68991 [Guillardia theta CCMP2712]